MSKAIIIGDGPAGLSAALLLAKNGVEAHVIGTDDTPMHKALLLNYLGIEEMSGTDFQELARKQVQNHGAHLHRGKVTQVSKTSQGFEALTESGESHQAPFLILATTNKTHQEQLGVERADGTAIVDRNGRTNVEGLYAVGWASRKEKIQAIISAGDGAAAAVDILSTVRGAPFHDFDVV